MRWGKKIALVCILFLVWNVALTLWTGHHGRGQRVCRRVGSCLSNSTAVVLTCEEVRKCLTETRRAKEENVLKRDKPCFDGRLWGLPMRANVLLSSYWTRCHGKVRVSAPSSSDNSSLLLPTLTAVYWHFVACGGAPGRLLAPVWAWPGS